MNLKNLMTFGAALLFTVNVIISCGGDDPPDPKYDYTITSVNGDYFKAVMGTTQTDRPLTFLVKDRDGNNEVDRWINFLRVVGDGHFTVDSAMTDSSGKVTMVYNFDGEMGNAELSALVRGYDTITVSVRANILKPGPSGQTQYVNFDDSYKEIVAYNGAPERVDIDPTTWILYVVYESTLGCVFVIEDIDHTNVPSENGPVLGGIVNNLLTTAYTGKTKDSIGLGSSIADFEAVYGLTNDFRYEDGIPGDPTNPPAWKYHYPFIGITFYTDTASVEADRRVYEIHLSELVVQ